jgi:hypothetical protein
MPWRSHSASPESVGTAPSRAAHRLIARASPGPPRRASSAGSGRRPSQTAPKASTGLDLRNIPPSVRSPGSATKLSAIRANRSRSPAAAVTPRPQASTPADRRSCQAYLPCLPAQSYGSTSPPPVLSVPDAGPSPPAERASCGRAGQVPAHCGSSSRTVRPACCMHPDQVRVTDRTRKQGRHKHHYLNPVPIRLIYERWIDKYRARQAAALLDLKGQLEGRR